MCKNCRLTASEGILLIVVVEQAHGEETGMEWRQLGIVKYWMGWTNGCVVWREAGWVH